MKPKTRKADVFEAVALVAMIATGVSILTLVILHAAKITDIRTDTLTLALLSVVCAIFVGALVPFIVLKVRAARKTGEAEEVTDETEGVEEPEEAIEETPEITEEETVEPATGDAAQDSATPAPRPEFDKAFTLDKISTNLAAYTAEKGLAISSECAKNIIAAACSSRLIAVADADEITVGKLAKILGDYFGEAANSLKDTLRFAYQNPEAVAIACVREEDILAVPSLVGHALNPDRGVKVTLGSGYSTLAYELPRNLWAVAPLARLSFVAAQSAALVCFEAGSAATLAQYREVGYEQLTGLARLSLDEFAPDEDKFWKKYDKIEKFVKDGSGYIAGNKKRRAVEAFASAYLACGGENALDCTAAAHLVAPSRLAADELTRVAESVLGEDGVTALVKTAKAVEKLWQI